jgi:hypothetical protein
MELGSFQWSEAVLLSLSGITGIMLIPDDGGRISEVEANSMCS